MKKSRSNAPSVGTNSPSSTELKIDWCSHQAAKFAVEHWHYSKCMPAGKTVKVGVWEQGQFVGCVIFSRGATKDLGKPYGLTQLESCELTRVALDKHETPVTRIIAIALKFLKRNSPGLRLIVSFADPEQGHHGGIYQAGNWIYAGRSKSAEEYIVNRKRMHGRSMRALYGTHLGKDFIKTTQGSSKFRYLMPLDDAIKATIMPLKQPFPERVKQATLSVQDEGGGAAPTHALQHP